MNLIYLTLSLVVCAHGQRMRDPQFVQHTPCKWKEIEFAFPSEEDREQALTSGNLRPTEAMLFDIQPHFGNTNVPRIFVTIPRFTNGIPFTLAKVSKKMGPKGPFIEPYPNYEIQKNKNVSDCDGITSAFHVAITECNQMWVIDSGIVGSNAVCPPQLLMFDLNNDTLVHRYRFDSSLYTPGASMFVSPVVNVRDRKNNCKDAMVYVADNRYDGLVVYSYMQDKAWRVGKMIEKPNNVNNVWGLMGGLFGMARDEKNLYFHSLSSPSEYAISLNKLDASRIFKENNLKLFKFYKVLGNRSTTCTASAMDSKNNLYCVTMEPIELLMWNVNTPYNKQNIKKLNIRPDELEFVSGMKVVRNKAGLEELWMASNRYQKMAAGMGDFNEVNFRIVIRLLNDIPIADSLWVWGSKK